MRLPTVSTSGFYFSSYYLQQGITVSLVFCPEMVCVNRKSQHRTFCLYRRVWMYKKRKKELITSIKQTHTSFANTCLLLLCRFPRPTFPMCRKEISGMNNYRYKHLGAIQRVFFLFWYSFKHFRLLKSSSEQFLRCPHSPVLQSRQGDEEAPMVICILIFSPSLFPPSIMLSLPI